MPALDKFTTLSIAESPPPPSECHAIAIMGATGTGKTSFVNKASGFRFLVGDGLESCTSQVDATPPSKVGDQWVTLFDTPGFDDDSKSDTDILKMIALFLAQAYESGKKLTGIIYIHRISDNRMGGIARRNFNMFRELCGEDAFKNVVVITTMWDTIASEVGDKRETQLKTDQKCFKPVLDKGAQLVRHDNTVASAQAILHCVLENTPSVLRIQSEIVDEGKTLGQTAAGVEINRELAKQAKMHKAEMDELRERMEDAIRERNDEARQEVEDATRELHEKMQRVKNDAQTLTAAHQEQMEQMRKQMREAAERAENELRIKIQELETSMSNARNVERANLERQIDELRRRPTCTIQ
ncbi:hypothetical protein MKEN_00374500 [Mycena kentingensis (nom. inval.)]|nr:hypothetical protein MKEN_00374500 [Mycena kentingensis (nom. inval.)]